MDINEVKTFIEQNKDSDDVKGFINSFYAPDKLSSVLDSEDGMKVLQPRLDKYHSKGIETWKVNNLPKIIDEEITKRFPGESEEQKRIKKLESEFNDQKKAATRAEIKNKAITKLTAEKMPPSLADLLIADDEETFNSKFNSVKSVWDKELNERIKVELKKAGRTVHKDDEKKVNTGEMNSIIRGAAGISSS